MLLKKFRKIALWAAALALSLSMLPMRASAASTVPYIQRMVQYYRYYQSDADAQIAALLAHIKQLNPAQGQLWQTIMDDWAWCNSDMDVFYDVLPDGLPEDDSLCIVVLGYELNADGSMKRELVSRLETALRSAQKYPNAYVAVTGGGSSVCTEAEVMAAWLAERGVGWDRLILEERSMSTTYNAVNTYAMLTRQYPQVESLALISSDYHVRWGCVMFQTVRDYTQSVGGNVIALVATAACNTGYAMNTMYYQAKGIATITGIPLAKNNLPDF